VGSTIVGDLAGDDVWRLKYSKSNPADTDNGYRPQNIFRLVNRASWGNYSQQAYFRVKNSNQSKSENRNESNGLLFFNRYQDAFNLYYAGLRVDGYAVIKKKMDGVYYTMAYEPFIKGGKYDREDNHNLIPVNKWVGLKTEVDNISGERVRIRFFVDEVGVGNWVLAAEAIDDGKKYGGRPILEDGHGGIRTDFMDVEFRDYLVTGK
jgi:hypothetical protein